jgi:hypothetical protein
VYAVKGSGEDEEVVAVKLCQPRVEISVEDEATGFVDYPERENDPGGLAMALACRA